MPPPPHPPPPALTRQLAPLSTLSAPRPLHNTVHAIAAAAALLALALALLPPNSKLHIGLAAWQSDVQTQGGPEATAGGPVSCRGGRCEPVQTAKVALVEAARRHLGSELARGLRVRLPSAELISTIRSTSRHPSLRVGAGGVAEIEAIDMSPALFRRFVHLNEPLVIRRLPELAGLADRWTDDSLRERAGDVPVRVERSRSARFGYEESDWRIEEDTLPYRTFLGHYLREGTEHPYAATEMPQELALDVALPPWTAGGRSVAGGRRLRQIISNATATNLYMWHGGGNRVSLLHADRAENLLMLAAGEKRLSLFHGDHGPDLAEDIWHIDKISSINISDPQQYTQRIAALKLHAVIRAGDALYLPMQCFHEVESVGRAVALSLWFDYHGLRETFGENVQGGGFSSREVLAVLLGGPRKEDIGEEDAETEDEDADVRTVLASLAGCLWADPVKTCTDFEAAAVALRQLEEGR